MSDQLTDLQKLRLVIPQIPGATMWPEEVLIRGQQSGGIKGAHVAYGVCLTDAFGNETKTIKGPYPVNADNADPEWQAIIGDVLIQQQAALADRDATITTLTADKANLASDAAAAKTASDTQVAALTQQVATLTAQLAAPTAAVADAVDDPANPPLSPPPEASA